MFGLLRHLLKRRPDGHATAPAAAACLQDTTDLLRRIADNSVDVIGLVGPDMRHRYFSPSITRLCGWEPEELVGTLPDALVFADDLPVVEAAIASQFAGKVQNTKTVFRAKCKDGSTVWVEAIGRTAFDPLTGAAGETTIVMRDITDRKLVDEHLHRLAHTDGLTGLANRRAFDEGLREQWSRTLEEASQLSLILLDIDHFKTFNDYYGHQLGDDCLRAVAATVTGIVSRPRDLAARYGGEELAVILPATNLGAATRTAEQIRAAVQALHLPNTNGSGRPVCITVSAGVATAMSMAGGSITMPEGLLTAADGALYKAKRAGRNRVETALLLTSVGARTLPNLASSA